MPAMFFIPAGEFLMGSPNTEKGRYSDEGPQHLVYVPAFEIGRYPVTFAEYDAFCDSICREKPNDNGWGRSYHPVINISWTNAKEYCNWLSQQTGVHYRLPTEAEWEYACRAGTQTRYHFGDDESKLGDYAWYIENSEHKTHTVGEKRSNPWGLYDMTGNVCEWVQDCYHETYEGAPADGSAWEDGECQYRVLRGGAWYGGVKRSRTAARVLHLCRGRADGIGFRLEKDFSWHK